MLSTGSRSREEWLAEVRRRGERLRRRRRVAFGLVGALALVVPVTAVATYLGGNPDVGVELTAAGPARPGDLLTSVPTTMAALAPPPTDQPVTVPSAPPGASASPSTTVEVHQRLSSVNGEVVASSPTSAPPPVDEPVVKPSTTTPAGNSSSPSPGPVRAAAPPTTVPPADPLPPVCQQAEVKITVATDKPSFGSGEAVGGTSTLENRSAAPCLLPTRAFFRVDDATGRSVGSFAYTTEFRLPVRAEPGKTFSSSFTWDQKDCSGSTCAQVPAGTYLVQADWTESGPYSGRASFQIGQ